MLKPLLLNFTLWVLFLFSNPLVAQDTLRIPNPNPSERLESVFSLPQDTSFIIAGNRGDQGYVARIKGNLSGAKKWEKLLPNNVVIESMTKATSGDFYITGQLGDFNTSKAVIYKINANDGTYSNVYTRTDTAHLNGSYSNSTGTLYTVGYTKDSLYRHPLFLTYTNGTVVTDSLPPNSLDTQYDVVVENKQQQVWVAGQNGAKVFLWKKGTSSFLWQNQTQAGEAPTFLVANTQFLYLGIHASIGQSSKILRFDANNGTLLQTIPVFAGLNAAIAIGDTGIICTGIANNRGTVQYFDANTLVLKGLKNIGNSSIYSESAALDTTSMGVVVAGAIGKDNTEDETDFFVALLNPSNVKQQATGKVYSINKCGDTPVVPLANWIVKGITLNDNKVHYALTDSLGVYFMQLDSLVTGPIVLQVTPKIGFVPCPIVVGTIIGNGLISTMPNLTIAKNDTLPRLVVDISTPYLRINDTISYVVRVANTSSASVSNVKVHVNFSPELIPVTPLNQDTVYFGTIQGNNVKTAVIKRKLLDSNPDVTKTYCATAQANISSRAWAGPRIVVTGDCASLPNDVQFTIKNNGTGAFSPSLVRKYFIIQDDVILRQGIVNNLNPGQSQIITAPRSNRSTYVCIVYQGEDNPYGSYASTRLEGCGTGGTYFARNIYSDYDDDLSYATECLSGLPELPTVSKTIVFPIGYGNSIPEVSDSITFEYHVVIVNNSNTDTAKTVVLDIMPSQKLDLGQIELGASTVPYTTQITKENHLIFTLSNINLPPINKDPKRAIGFLNYRIKVPIGPTINNENVIFTTQTTIQFDYGGTFVEDSIPRIIKPNGGWMVASVELVPTIPLENIHIAPNPFIGTTNITVPDTWLGATFHLYNLQGQLLRQILITQPSFLLSAEGLNAGSYYCSIQRKGVLLAKGKIILKE
ncbi:MAG: hypothetical protein RLZZ292_1076 [Bacteroidota bacterium]|jgi:hypothetical protein